MDSQAQATALRLIPLVADLRSRALAFEQAHSNYVAAAAPGYRNSARNLPAVFDSALPGERIWFDDGKIGGIIADNDGMRLLVTITQAAPGGARLRAGKGINLPCGGANG